MFPGCVFYILHLPHQFPDTIQKIFLQIVICRQHFHPFGHIKFHLHNRKFIKDLLQDPGNIFFSELLAVYADHSRLIFFLQFLDQILGFFLIGFLRIYQDQKGLTCLFQFLNRFLFPFYVIFPGNFPEGPIAGDHQTNAGMFLDHFSGTCLRRLMKRDLIVKPGGFHHPFFSLFNVSCRITDHKSHAVYQTYFRFQILSQRNPCCLLWDKFGLYCSDHFTGTA